MRIFVGNLDFQAREGTIRQLFEPFGAVQTVEIATDWETGHSRGFAFVQMPNDSEADLAIAGLSGKALDGRSLAVRHAPSAIPVGFRALAIEG